jgi:hypothetical protein
MASTPTFAQKSRVNTGILAPQVLFVLLTLTHILEHKSLTNFADTQGHCGGERL